MDKDAAAPPADALAGLVDIPLPAPVGLWPQTWASQIAIVVLAAGLMGLIWWVTHRHRINRYRRIALAELDAIDHESPYYVAELASLLRRTALAAFPRVAIVPLSQADWLSFLDRTYGGTAFSSGPAAVLATAPYRPISEADTPATRAVRQERDDLASLVARWIRKHHA